MKELPINPVTARKAKSFTDNPSHALLLVGEDGSGKSAIAIVTSEKVLNTKLTNVNSLVVDNGGAQISIDDARAVKSFLKLKTIGEKVIRRVVIIKNAQFLGVEAQNALLKVLEEPPADALIILTAASEGQLVPTIASRCSTIRVLPVSKADALKFFGNNYSNEKIGQAYLLSGGASGLLNAILEGNKNHPIFEEIELAKQLVTMPPYERLTKINQLAKSEAKILGLIRALAKILSSALYKQIDMDSGKTQNILNKLKIVDQVNNSNIHLLNKKLLLTHVLLSI